MEARIEQTVLRSLPDLWAELSDEAALARRLAPFGAVRLTATSPLERVEWESEHYKGSLHLSSAGWGTKVTAVAARRVAEGAGEKPPPAPPAREEPLWGVVRSGRLPGWLKAVLPLRRPRPLFKAWQAADDPQAPLPPSAHQEEGALLEAVVGALSGAGNRPSVKEAP